MMESEVLINCATQNQNDELPLSKGHLQPGKPKSFDDKIKSEIASKNCELLGSVTMENCPGVRTSARVIQKMKENSCRATTPPPNERELKLKEEKALQKTPSQTKPTKVIWTNLERNFFFDAVNEFGKDFEGIANFINTKLKRKSITDQCFKTKEQIRTTYYQTFHKLSKYIKFSDDVKKPIQELYALINYGEMRRKLQFVSEKNCIKIKDLVYKGYVTVRSKGKNIRVKTPSCKALRKLNQLEDWLEDIKLPPKVEVCLRPASMESWARVQNIAQNPVIRTSVPLQKKLVNVIKTFQHKWRSRETNLIFEASKIIHSNLNNNDVTKAVNHNIELDTTVQEPLICFRPLPETNIHRPLVSITEFLSSFNICLNSYEERIGVKVRGETLCHIGYPHKRARTDSGCEKRSPDGKKIKAELNDSLSNNRIANQSATDVIELTEITKPEIIDDIKHIKINSSGESTDGNIELTITSQDNDLPDEFVDILCDNDNNDLINIKNDQQDSNSDVDNRKINNNNNNSSNDCLNITDNKKKSGIHCNTSSHKIKKKYLTKCSRKRESKKDVNNLRPLVSEEVIRKIRKGWTILNAGDITIGDLYIVLGQDSKLIFEYSWIEENCGAKPKIVADDTTIFATGMVTYNGSISGNNDDLEKQPIEAINKIQECSLGNKLKQLLLIANLSDRMKRKPCSCGHSCEKFGRARMDIDLSNRSFVAAKQYSANNSSDMNLFRQPAAPFRKPTLSMESLKQFANDMNFKQSRVLRGGTSAGPRQVVVQRVLPVQPGLNQSYDVVEMKTLQNNLAESNRQKTKQKIQEDAAEQHLNNISSHTIVDSDKHQQTKATQVEIQLDNINEMPPLLTGNLTIDTINTTKPETCKSFHTTTTPTTNNNNNNGCSGDKYDDPDLSALMELSLPSPLPINKYMDNNTNETSFISIPSMSPMNFLRDGSDTRWLEENFNDFSLSSLLGHLDEINNGRDITAMDSNISVMSETSVDYMSKFAEIAASMQNDDKDF